MTNLSFVPLSNRFIGFDDLFVEMNRALTDYKTIGSSANNFPPFNLYQEPSGYTIELALAGYKKDQIYIRHDKKRGTLTIGADGAVGFGKSASEPSSRKLLKGGIALRSFDKVFTVADNLIVKSAEMKDGLLTVKLEIDEREEDKPLSITVS